MSPFSRPPFDVTRIENPGEVRLVLDGEVDIATAPLLAHAIEQAERQRPAMLVLDAARLTFIDASGVRVLVRAARHARRAGRGLTLRNPPPPVARMLGIVGVGDLLDIVVEQAPASG